MSQMKKSTSFPCELYEANSEMGPSPAHQVPSCSPEFQQQLEVYRETVCSIPITRMLERCISACNKALLSQLCRPLFSVFPSILLLSFFMFFFFFFLPVFAHDVAYDDVVLTPEHAMLGIGLDEFVLEWRTNRPSTVTSSPGRKQSFLAATAAATTAAAAAAAGEDSLQHEFCLLCTDCMPSRRFFGGPKWIDSRLVGWHRHDCGTKIVDGKNVLHDPRMCR